MSYSNSLMPKAQTYPLGAQGATAVGMRITGFPNEPPITFLSREATVVIRVTGMEPG
jgi:hypothetical protein